LTSFNGFLSDRVRGVAGHDPACGPSDDGFILEPEQSEVVDAQWKLRLDFGFSSFPSASNLPMKQPFSAQPLPNGPVRRSRRGNALICGFKKPAL
jgi:hypothetical protein